MNQTAEAINPLHQDSSDTEETSISLESSDSVSSAGQEQSSPTPAATATVDSALSEATPATPEAPDASETSMQASDSLPNPEAHHNNNNNNNNANSNETATSTTSSDSASMDSAADGAKKTRAPRTPKAAGKPAEAGGSIGTIVERVVRMTTLTDEHAAALGRLFNVSLPEDYVARLTRLTGASLGPIGTGAVEALAIVLGLESANPIHVGVQLGRLAATSLPDVYRCAHALTGEPAPALPKGDHAVFAVADVLATLTVEDFALAKALSAALE